MDMEDTLLNSAAAERNKKLGAENKIGHSIFFQQPPPPPLPTHPINNKRQPLSFFKRRRQHLDPSDAIFNGADNKNYVGKPSTGAWEEGVWIKNEMSKSNRLRTLFLVLKRRVDVYLNFPK